MSYFHPVRFLHYWANPILFFVFISLGTEKDTQTDLFLLKSLLSSRLDSLEVEKQNKARGNLSLDSIDTMIKVIQDSISIVRKNYGATSPVVQKHPKQKTQQNGEEKKPKLSIIASVDQTFRHPEGYLDWSIIVVGCIAVITGFLCIIAILRLIIISIKGPQKRKKQTITPVIKPKTASSATPHEKESLETIVFTKNKKIFPVEQTEPQSESTTTTYSLRSLRNRIKASDPDNTTNVPREAPTENSPQQIKKNEKPITYIKNRTIRDDIIESAEKGMDAKEIAKIYKVSIDQVRLILKMVNK